MPIILDAAKEVGEAYSQFGEPTETLVTKVLLGTLGCLPACDQYFVAGFRGAGLGYSYLNAKFVKKLLAFPGSIWRSFGESRLSLKTTAERTIRS